jgi:hypothetical protein
LVLLPAYDAQNLVGIHVFLVLNVMQLSSEIAFKVQNFYLGGGGGEGKQIKRESIVTGTETIFLPNTHKTDRLTPDARQTLPE